MFRRPTPEAERSAEERARAAAERAARRAAREGRPFEPPPPATFGATAGEPGVREEPASVPDAEPVTAESEPAVDPGPGPVFHSPPEPEPEPEPGPGPVFHSPPEPEPEPEPGPGPVFHSPPEPEPVVEPEAEPVGEPDPARAAYASEGQTAEWTPDTDRAPDVPSFPTSPPPPGSRPVELPRRGRWRPERGQKPLASSRPLAASRTRATTQGGHGRGRGRIVALLAILLLALALYLVNAIFQPFHGEGRSATRVSIPAGADAGRIGDILAERGVVGSARSFTLNATLTGRRGGLRPGRYTLPRDLSNGAAIEALARGPRAPPPIKTFDLTIPEGRSASETAARLEETSIDGDYLQATRNRALLRRARGLGLPRGSGTLEGLLYPATYKLPERTTARELVERQLDGFGDHTEKVSYTRARRKKLTRYEVLIIASMIEREAQLDRERPLVSAVIYNRLSEGMPLGIDATIRYAADNWTRPILKSELEKDGPFNSRTRRGLPPTPIGNPGLASIRAAARPANVDYLYYVVKPRSKGAHAFSSSDARFQRDVARYQAARSANGGQAP